jgi:hypothetical protein
LKKEAATKKSQGAASKKRAIMKELNGDGVKKGPTAKELEEDDVYRLNTCVHATPTAAAIQKNIVETSPRKTHHAIERVDAVGVEEDASNHVRCEETLVIPGSPIIAGSSKLLIFNVHGTLLDCTLLEESNPNTKIKATMNAASRRIICRPWMADFRKQCFLTFKVAFWGSKNAQYMVDVVSIMLGRVKGKHSCVPCFIWSAQDYEPVDSGEGGQIDGGKPLDRVYSRWPCWNASNTVIINHNLGRIACNPRANIITPNAFYVEHLQKLGDDKNYLKSTLWPLLQDFFDADDVEEFRRDFPCTVGLSENALREEHQEFISSDIQGCLQGEGTGGSRFMLNNCPLILHFQSFLTV